MRHRLPWLLLLSSLVAGALACQGSSKDASGDLDPIGDYPNAGGGEGPIGDYPKAPGGGLSGEAEQEPPPEAIPPQSPTTGDRGHEAPSVSGSPPFAAAADAGPDSAEVDAGASEADADGSEALVAPDAGAATP